MPIEIDHDCDLPEDIGGQIKLPPNASFGSKVCRYLRKFLAPNPKSAICKRNFRNQSQMNTERRRHAQSKYVYIIHPYSDFEFVRELLFVFIAFWEIFTAPLKASFGYRWRYSNPDIIYQMNIFNLPNLCVFLMDVSWIVSCFFTAYKESRTKTIQLEHRKIIKRYLLTYFWFDLLAISPPVVFNEYETYIYWINLSIFARLGTIVKYMKRFLTDARVPENAVTLMVLITLSFVIVHVFSCIFYVLPLQFHLRENELWLVRTKLHPNARLVKVYFSCFSMIQTHFWGLGEATMKIENTMEGFILIIAMIIGRLWSLYLLATVLRIFTISSLSESKYEEYLFQLKTFISQKQLPSELADRLLEYYRYKYQHHYFNERIIFNAMSSLLKQEIILFGARNVINKVTIFKYFPRSIISDIIAKCRIMVFLNHDIVKNEGELIEDVYLISCGTLAVFNNQGVELTHLSDGDEVGLLGLVSTNDTYHRFTYTAIETIELYVINIKDFRAILHDKGDILHYFSKRIEERIREMEKIENLATAAGVDILSELQHGKLLEHPRIRTRFFEQ